MAYSARMGAGGTGAGTERGGVLEQRPRMVVLWWVRMEVERERPYMTP
jgi:hypothetical protein